MNNSRWHKGVSRININNMRRLFFWQNIKIQITSSVHSWYELDIVHYGHHHGKISFKISDSQAVESVLFVALPRVHHLLWLCDLTVDVVLHHAVGTLLQRSVDNKRYLVVISRSIEQQQSTSKQTTVHDLHAV